MATSHDTIARVTAMTETNFPHADRITGEEPPAGMLVEVKEDHPDAPEAEQRAAAWLLLAEVALRRAAMELGDLELELGLAAALSEGSPA